MGKNENIVYGAFLCWPGAQSCTIGPALATTPELARQSARHIPNAEHCNLDNVWVEPIPDYRLNRGEQGVIVRLWLTNGDLFVVGLYDSVDDAVSGLHQHFTNFITNDVEDIDIIATSIRPA